jgi:hypothetical protein
MTMRIAILLGVLVSIGCAKGEAPPPSNAHPANPGAPEGTPMVASSPATPSAAPHDHGAATIYTCPMHPEVTSDKPGQCPKCGMNLVPKK